MRHAALLLCCAAPVLAALGGVARGHVAPSVSENNRYLKLTPTADQVRLSYTVYFGEIPGREARAGMDRDRDGAISDAESDAFAGQLGDRVAAALTATASGLPAAITWQERHIGLGSPTTTYGPFAVDLVAWICVPADGDERWFELRDRFEIERPGETELRVDESPGIHVTRSSFGKDGTPSQLAFRWTGEDSPTASVGHHLRWKVVDAKLAMGAAAGRCSEGAGGHRRGWILAGAATIVAAAALALWRRRRGEQP